MKLRIGLITLAIAICITLLLVWGGEAQKFSFRHRLARDYAMAIRDYESGSLSEIPRADILAVTPEVLIFISRNPGGDPKTWIGIYHRSSRTLELHLASEFRVTEYPER